jgi:hypothetical protein
MPKHIIKAPVVNVNSVNLSTYVSQFELDLTKDDVEITAGGDGGKTRLAGLQKNTVTVTWRQDFALTKVDATLAPLWSGQTSFPVTWQGDGSSTTYTASNCYLLDYAPVGGTIGDAADATTTFSVSGVVTRA